MEDDGLQHDMLDDAWWNAFTGDAADYELGGAVGFGAWSTVYSGLFLPRRDDSSASSSTPRTTPPASERDPSEHPRKPNLSINIPPPRSKDSAAPGRVCAIKVSSVHADVVQLYKETRLLALSRHPNVLRVLASFTLPPDHRRIALVTPLIAGGSLAGILEWRSRLSTSPRHRGVFHRFSAGNRHRHDGEEVGLSEEEVKAVVRQVLGGLAYLHSKGFLHRDLKAGNLLVAPDGHILLADFGVGGDVNEAPDASADTDRGRPAVDSLRFEKVDSAVNGNGRHGSKAYSDTNDDLGRRKSFVGTPNWMAPEVVLGQKYDAKADIWSLGITILELAHGSVPGAREKPSSVLASIVTGKAPSLEGAKGEFSKQMKEFVDACLAKDPTARPTAAQLLEHHWLKGAKKKAWLAEALLTDVPPLEHRQEIRRVPTMSSMVSVASSWDFSATPYPSIPTSPARTSLLLSASATSPAIRSPSIISQLHDYFPAMPSRTHSRSSSRIPSMPPSPTVPLRKWAERTASEGSEATFAAGGDLMGMSRRTGSGSGTRRSASRLGAMGDRRRGQSGSGSMDLRVSRSEAVLSRGGGSIDLGRSARRLPSTEDDLRVELLGSDLPGGVQTEAAPMSPVIEVTQPTSLQREILPEKREEAVVMGREGSARTVVAPSITTKPICEERAKRSGLMENGKIVGNGPKEEAQAKKGGKQGWLASKLGRKRSVKH